MLCWLLSGPSTIPFDCQEGSTWEAQWPQAKKDFCCQTVGRGCATPANPGGEIDQTAPPTPFPTQPPTPPPTPPLTPPVTPPTPPPGPVDPFNCAVGEYFSWEQAK